MTRAIFTKYVVIVRLIRVLSTLRSDAKLLRAGR